jgi:hypothetical protein
VKAARFSYKWKLSHRESKDVDVSKILDLKMDLRVIIL